MAFIYDPSTPDNRSPEEKILDINNRLAELPRLRKQEEDRAGKGATQDETDKQLARIAKTEDTLLAAKAELGMRL